MQEKEPKHNFRKQEQLHIRPELSKTISATPLEEGSCVHHWQIEPPNGPYSSGVCKKCNEVRLHPNSEAAAEALSPDKTNPREAISRGDLIKLRMEEPLIENPNNNPLF